MIVTAEIDLDGEVYFNRVLGEPRFLEPNRSEEHTSELQSHS